MLEYHHLQSSGGPTNLPAHMESADEDILRRKIREGFRRIDPLRQTATCTQLVCYVPATPRLVQEKNVGRMACEDEVPWLGGVCPSPIVNLDDKEMLKRYGIVLQVREHQKKGDYYMHVFGRRWFVVERKDRPSKFSHVVAQITDTVIQLREQQKTVDGVAVVAEGINFRERGVYDIDRRNNNEVFYKLSRNKNRVMVEGISLRFYTPREVEGMRRR